jgi:hypothetical protein
MRLRIDRTPWSVFVGSSFFFSHSGFMWVISSTVNFTSLRENFVSAIVRLRQWYSEFDSFLPYIAFNAYTFTKECKILVYNKGDEYITCGTFVPLSGYWKCQTFAQQSERESVCVFVRPRACARVCVRVSHLLKIQSLQTFKTHHPLKE